MRRRGSRSPSEEGETEAAVTLPGMAAGNKLKDVVRARRAVWGAPQEPKRGVCGSLLSVGGGGHS